MDLIECSYISIENTSSDDLIWRGRLISIASVSIPKGFDRGKSKGKQEVYTRCSLTCNTLGVFATTNKNVNF